jgi:internalin A
MQLIETNVTGDQIQSVPGAGTIPIEKFTIYNRAVKSEIDLRTPEESKQQQTPKVGPKRNKIFISYSHKDQRIINEFKTTLAPVVRSGAIDLWDDSKIKPGMRWKEEIKTALGEAKVAVLLVSPHFLASDFITNHELLPLLDSAGKDGVTIFWVLVSVCLWDKTEIVNYQAAHDPKRPLDLFDRPKRQVVIDEICRKLIQVVGDG